MKIVVSACLMGESCKYNGLDNYHRELVEACERTGTEVLLVCPEVFGGLPTPRKPSEIVRGEVRTCEGVSVDREFRLGAERALDMCEQAGGPSEIAACVLQDRSPSCGGVASTMAPLAVRSPWATVFLSTFCSATVIA